jgi:hypothetical protein
MPAHELSTDEVRTRFLEAVWRSIDGAARSDRPPREQLQHLAFSLLCALDGSVVGLPGFVVAPRPHPDDRAWSQERGEDWFPQNHRVKVRADIAGELHEQFFEVGRRLGLLAPPSGRKPARRPKKKPLR